LVDPVKIARRIKAATSALSKPNIIVPDVEVARRLRAAESVGGREAIERLVRAQDQGADLTYFHPDAIHNALDPSYGNLLTTIDPKTFQDYSFRIPPETLRDPQYRMAGAFNQAGRTGMTGNLDDVLNHYAKIAKEGRWDEVPNLSFGLDRETARYGWHPNDVTQRALPRVTSHEGRHRSMTMAGPLGDDSSLVVIKPDSYDLSRAYAHLDPSEYRPALKDMLEAEGSGRVIPQYSGSYEPLANRGFQDEQDFPRLPETWAEGGGVPGFHSDYGTPTFDIPLGDGKGTAGFSYDPTAQIVDALLGYEHPIGKQGARLGASGSFNKYVGPGGDQAKPRWGAGLRLTVPFAEGGGALSQLAAINPLKLINFFNKGALKESLDPSVQKGVERVLKHVDETGNEALVHGRYGDDLAKPYTGRMLPGDKGSVRLTDTVKKNLWANAPGQPWSVHPHPDMDAPFGLPKVPWSNMPSEGDIYSSYLPKSMWSSFGNLPEMLVANQHGNLVRLGGVHNAWDEGAGYSQRRDVAQHIGSIFDQKSRFGATSDESKAMEDAYADWAKAHGLADYKPRVPILHPKTGAVAAAWNPASLDLATVPSLARLSDMGVPVDVQGNLSGYPSVPMGDAMKSWADYLERKTGNPLKDSDPAQLDFNFGKAEGGMIRNYAFGGPGLPADDSQDAGDTDVTQDQEGGALSQVGYRPTGGALSRRIAAALEEEKRLNALRGPKAAPIYLPPDPKIQTVTNPERMAFAGIYKPPAQIIAEAKARYDEGDEQAMRRLFSVDRQSLDDLSQSRNYSNLFMQPHAYYPPPGATGSAISDKVLTPSNMNRITNVAEAALDDPQLSLTRSWY
jgi:hypothetical protein